MSSPSFPSPILALLAGVLCCLSAQAEVLEIRGMTQPFSLVFDERGDFWGVEYEEGNRVFSGNAAAGTLSFVAGKKFPGGKKLGDVTEGDGSSPKQARFNGMHDLAFHPDGRLFLADTFNLRLRVISADGTKVESLSPEAWKSPYTVDIHPDGKTVLVADLQTYRVLEMDLESRTVRAVAGNGKRGLPLDGTIATQSPLRGPRAAIYGADGETIWIASREGNALRRVDEDGVVTTVVNRSGKKGYGGDGGPGGEAKLHGPKHLSLHPEGDIVIVDDVNHCVRLYKVEDGTIHLLAGCPEKPGSSIGAGRLDTEFNRPHGARYDAEGRLWVCDSFNDRLLRFSK